MSTAVRIPAGECILDADLARPDSPVGVVAFAHGSGSGRHSPRNREVASVLQEAHLVTLLADLLTPDEERADLRSGHLRFDIGLLAGRLVDIAGWLSAEPTTAGLALGLFGASTGAAAALVAAARLPEDVAAVVSRGGRPDLAGGSLGAVRAPTLLIVGGRDEVVLGLNQQALDELCCDKTLEVVPGATHLFEEPGALQAVAALARSWFLDHLVRGDR
jgi:dienelactone hydrolase